MRPVTSFTGQRGVFLLVAGLLLSAAVLFISCKKNDFASPASPVDRAGEFFKTTSNNKDVLRIIGLLKSENERTGFLSTLPASSGLPVWEKIVLQKNGTATRGEAGDSTEHYVIPLTSDNTNLSSVIIAESVTGGYLINCYTATEYLYKATHDPAIDSAKATNALTLFFYMESYTFVNNTFYHIPARFFGNSKILDADGNKTISIKPVAGNNTTDSSGLVPVQWICMDYVCPVCNGVDPNCPLGGYWTVCTPVGGGGGQTPPFPPPGNPPGPPPPGGGGGSGGGGGNPIPLPGECREAFYIIDPCGLGEPLPPEAPDRDMHGFLYTRIAELNNILALDPFALSGCDSLELINLQTYGPMYQRIAQYNSPQVVLDRLDSVRQAQNNWSVDNYNIQSLAQAYGPITNCDYFPLSISQFPVNTLTSQPMTPGEFVEFFRLNINQFITSPVSVSFSCAGSPQFNDCVKWNMSSANALGAIYHVHIPGNDGSVILSDYQHINNTGSEQHYFKFSTLETPFDYEHPVAGNREFGVFNTPGNPGQFTFYILAVDRTWDWITALLNSTEYGFAKSDELWINIQTNLKAYINQNGGTAATYAQTKYIARPKWIEVREYLFGTIDIQTLKQRLGC